MFHSQQWLARVQQKAGNQLTAMKAEHGLMREQPEQFNQWMHEWLHDGQSWAFTVNETIFFKRINIDEAFSVWNQQHDFGQW